MARWIAIILIFVCGSSAAAEDEDCGSLENGFGPYDYTNPEHVTKWLWWVEPFHFTPEVEALISGHTGYIEADLDYTLRAFPNHHRALFAVLKLQLRDGYRRVGGYRTVECYFDRAMRFAPDDGVVRMLYGIYLHRKGKYQEALTRYKEAERFVPGDTELSYNLGLLMCDLNRCSEAIPYAQKAYSAGYPLPGLKQRLIDAKLWNQVVIRPDKGPKVEENKQP